MQFIHAQTKVLLYNPDRFGGGRNIAVGDPCKSGNGTTEIDSIIQRREKCR